MQFDHTVIDRHAKTQPFDAAFWTPVKQQLLWIILVSCVGISPSLAPAYEVNEKVTLGAAGRTFVQYGHSSNTFDMNGKELDDKPRGVLIGDLTADFHPTDSDEFYTWFRFVKGNGLNRFEPAVLTPYGGDVRDDVKDINETNRSYLLEAWYKRTFGMGDTSALAATAGIIDSAAYIDDNAYANDPDAQFMHEIFSNSNLPGFPSYAVGTALEFDTENWSLRSVYMNLKNEEDRTYNYFAGQAGYRLETALGEGNYRLFVFTTNDRFQDSSSNPDEKALSGYGVSTDQQLGAALGIFFRAAIQQDVAVVNFDRQFSSGANVNGRLWGRPTDECGLGYAYLNGGSGSDFDNSHVVEAYIKYQLSKHADLSFDVQYQKSSLNDDGGRGNPDLWVLGTRLNAYF